MPVLAGSVLVGVALLALYTISTPALAQTGAGAAKTDAGNERGIIGQRSKDALVLSPAQQAIVNKTTSSPETKNVSVFKMPDAATVEDLLSRPPPQENATQKSSCHSAETKKSPYCALDRRSRRTRALPGGARLRKRASQRCSCYGRTATCQGISATSGSVFMVNRLGGDVHTVAEFDPASYHRTSTRKRRQSTDEPTTPALRPPDPTVTPFPDAERQALEAKNITIDIMILYTKNAANKHIGDPADLLALKIEETQTKLSGTAALATSACGSCTAKQIDYDETGANLFKQLYAWSTERAPSRTSRSCATRNAPTSSV